MKIIFFLFILITSLTFSQTRIKSFINSRAEVYSHPTEDSLTQKIFNPFDEVIVTGVSDDFYKVEGFGYVKRECVFQNDSLVNFNFTLVPAGLKTLKDSIKSYVRNYASIYSYPNNDSNTYKSLPPMTDVIVTESVGDFYRIYGYGYVQKYSVFQNDDILLLEKGMNKEQRGKYKEGLELTRLEKEQEELKQKQFTYEKRKKELINKFGKKNAQRILEGKVWIGMTKEMARESWGSPQDINRTITANGVHEQWVYGDSYLYFNDGILTTIQD